MISVANIFFSKEFHMSENPQYIRTDKAIKQALITLLKIKPFETL